MLDARYSSMGLLESCLMFVCLLVAVRIYTSGEVHAAIIFTLFFFCYSVCCTAYYLPQNAGDIARKYIKDPQLLSFIDAEVRNNIFV